MTLRGTCGKTALTCVTIMSSSDLEDLLKSEGLNSEAGIIGPLGTALGQGGGGPT